MAYLAADETESKVRPRFERWVSEWILSRGRLNCDASDLYGARCAVVHTWSAESSVSEKGEAKPVFYYFGDEDPASLKERILQEAEKYTLLHIDTLINETKEAGVCFLGSCGTNLELRKRVLSKVDKLYVSPATWLNPDIDTDS
jgi:hypothetical protein